jgi:hypothetical protein
MKSKNGSVETKPVSTSEADKILKQAAARAAKRLRLFGNAKVANGRATRSAS